MLSSSLLCNKNSMCAGGRKRCKPTKMEDGGGGGNRIDPNFELEFFSF